MRFINYLIKESILTADLNIISNNGSDPFDNTYGDIPGALGSNFMPVVPDKPDESDEINDKKKAFVERVGAETKANGLPFFLELLTYDGKIDDAKGEEYAKVKPEKVFKTMEEFSKPQYDVTVLKVEMPFNIKFVEGYNGDNNVVYTQEEAKKLLKKQSDLTDLPYIFLSAGVTSEEFIAEIKMAEEAGADFNGVLCGRATWKPAIKPFAAEGEKQGREWLSTEGKKNIENLNDALKGAKSWKDKLEIEE